MASERHHRRRRRTRSCRAITSFALYGFPESHAARSRCSPTRQRLPEGAPPGGVLLRAAQRLADGLLPPGDAGQGRAAPRRRGAARSTSRARAGAARSRTAGARVRLGPALRRGPARGDRASGSRRRGRRRRSRRWPTSRARAQPNAARAGDAGRGRRAGGAGRARARRRCGRSTRSARRARCSRARSDRRRRHAVAAARDDRRRGDGGRLPRHAASRPGRTRSRSRAPTLDARASRAPPSCAHVPDGRARPHRRRRDRPPAPRHRQGLRVHHPRGRDRLRQRHRHAPALRRAQARDRRRTARWSSRACVQNQDGVVSIKADRVPRARGLRRPPSTSRTTSTDAQGAAPRPKCDQNRKSAGKSRSRCQSRVIDSKGAPDRARLGRASDGQDQRRSRAAHKIKPRRPPASRGSTRSPAAACRAGRPTLVCGGAGCGKTLLGDGVPGARRRSSSASRASSWRSRRPPRSSPQNVALARLRSRRAGRAEEARSSTTSTSSAARSRRPASTTSKGCSSASGYAIDSIGAKRVVLDTIETLFGGFANQAILRAELRRLFRWLKDKGVTAVITGERGDGTLTRQGLEEYVSDCVILLDHRVTEQVSTRRLRVVKYRGTRARHQRVPVPDRRGRHLGPADHLARARARGVATSGSRPASPRLDAMLGGEGFYRGSSVLVSGTAGTGKTSLAAHFADAACRARRALPLLRLRGVAEPDRPQHALDRHRPASPGSRRACCASTPRGRRCTAWRCTWRACTSWSREFEPRVVSSTRSATSSTAGTLREAEAMLMRLIDFLKSAADHRLVHQPDRAAATRWSRPTSASRR